MGEITSWEYSIKTGETVTIRTPSVTDAAALTRFARAIFSEHEFLILEPGEFLNDVEQEMAWIAELTLSPRNVLIMAEVNKEVVGLLDFTSGRFLRLSHTGTMGVSLRQSWTGKGIGTMLLQSFFDWAARSPGIEKVSLSVFSDNEKAIRFYLRLGFEEEGRKIRGIKYMSGRYQDEIIMSKFVK